jgi:hypothetical protein
MEENLCEHQKAGSWHFTRRVPSLQIIFKRKKEKRIEKKEKE